MSTTKEPAAGGSPAVSTSQTLPPESSVTSPTSALLAIKAELRASMNGIASRTIRESGMGYHLVFGVELPRLREIALEFRSDGSPEGDAAALRLAIALWKEDIRECKLLAVLICPLGLFDRDLADIWLADLPPEQAEVAQLLAMELLCHVPEAADLAFRQMADERLIYQLCGFLTLTRLIMQGGQLSPDSETEFLDQAAASLPSSYLPLRKAVQNALLHYADSSYEARQKAEQLLCN